MHHTQQQPTREGIDPTVIDSMVGEVRAKTWQALNDIKEMIVPGMSETEAISCANRLFASRGVRKFWHKTHIRFGRSTTLGFNDPYDNTILKEDDIFYLDVGPIWTTEDGKSIEADVGKTFVIGKDPARSAIVRDVEIIFGEMREHWLTTKASGVELLQVAQKKSVQRGYVLHPSYVKGHRLSEFPHKIYGDGNLFDLQNSPSPARWVLEIQICSPDMQYGAFYEDLLV
jgi:CDP-4-dehydro-6-deoxyglucose reductase